MTAPPWSTRRIFAPDGVGLAVHETGSGPVLLCLHGYPDDATLWDGVARELAGSFRVVAPDVRGAGRSDRPAGRAAYRLDRLLDDLLAVLDSVGEDQVHLLGHDWGSIQGWHAVGDERFRGRLATFTSISGPGLDGAARWARSRLRPEPRALGELVRQLAASSYVAAFQLPVLPELVWRTGAVRRAVAGSVTRREGTAPPGWPSPDDAVAGLQLYRANLLRPRAAAQGTAHTPVQLLVPAGDPAVSVPLQTGAARAVSDPLVRVVDGGHWLPRSRPDLVARHVVEFTGGTPGRPGGGAEERA